MNKWYRTTNGNGKKTLDCKDIERIAVSVLEGKKEGITKVVFGDQWCISGYHTSNQNTGYTFEASDKNNIVYVDLDDWKYVCMEEWENTLFIYVTDYKPADEKEIK